MDINQLVANYCDTPVLVICEVEVRSGLIMGQDCFGCTVQPTVLWHNKQQQLFCSKIYIKMLCRTTCQYRHFKQLEYGATALQWLSIFCGVYMAAHGTIGINRLGSAMRSPPPVTSCAYGLLMHCPHFVPLMVPLACSPRRSACPSQPTARSMKCGR